MFLVIEPITPEPFSISWDEFEEFAGVVIASFLAVSVLRRFLDQIGKMEKDEPAEAPAPGTLAALFGPSRPEPVGVEVARARNRTPSPLNAGWLLSGLESLIRENKPAIRRLLNEVLQEEQESST